MPDEPVEFKSLQPLSEAEVKFPDRPNPWARISEVAAKVGVKPTPRDTMVATICAQGADGQWYDVWDVISAVLDRLEKADAARPQA